MENCMMTSPQLIADSYERYHFPMPPVMKAILM